MQITSSWQNHRYVGLFIDTRLSEEMSFFPSPQQVAATDLTTLRSAGLSGRKAEYSS